MNLHDKMMTLGEEISAVRHAMYAAAQCGSLSAKEYDLLEGVIHQLQIERHEVGGQLYAAAKAAAEAVEAAR